MANEGVRTSRVGKYASEGTRLLWGALAGFGGSQGQLARAVGVPSSVVNRWLHGDRRPGLRWAMRLEEVAGIRPAAWGEAPVCPIVIEPTPIPMTGTDDS